MCVHRHTYKRGEEVGNPIPLYTSTAVEDTPEIALFYIEFTLPQKIASWAVVVL